MLLASGVGALRCDGELRDVLERHVQAVARLPQLQLQRSHARQHLLRRVLLQPERVAN